MCNFYHFYSSRIYILEFLVLRIECLLIYIQCCIHTNLSVTDTLSYFLSQDAGLTISTASASGYGIWDIQISAEIFISHNNFTFYFFHNNYRCSLIRTMVTQLNYLVLHPNIVATNIIHLSLSFEKVHQ